MKRLNIPANIENLNMAEFDYDLAEEMIAQYPLKERDSSKLLLYDGSRISSDIFRNLHLHIPSGSMLVFNNTRVIKARLLFKKPSGANVEIMCLEPLTPGIYEESFTASSPVVWKCIVGNLKKWKSERLAIKFMFNEQCHALYADKIGLEGEAWRIRFSWDKDDMSFGTVLEAIGHVPLPPYISREDEKEDYNRYQTVYSKIQGSVAAPTAGLHFTNEVLGRLSEEGVKMAYITLHVGAGTFQPVRSADIFSHEMHCEHFSVTLETIHQLIENIGRIIAVGTTSVRTLESLYWLGVKIIQSKGYNDMNIGQWDPYKSNLKVTEKEALEALKEFIMTNHLACINTSTKVMIIPGYRFRLTNGIITNFHQPKSTLLLLVSAWAGSAWKEIYRYAIENNFRFLSYGDSSLLFNSLDKIRF